MENEPIIIDFTKLDESGIRAFGYQLELLLKRMFGLNEYDFKVRGPSDMMEYFIDSVQKETDYIKMFNRHGLNDPSTWKSKYQLEKSIKNFEKESGIKWPLR